MCLETWCSACLGLFLMPNSCYLKKVGVVHRLSLFHKVFCVSIYGRSSYIHIWYCRCDLWPFMGERTLMFKYKKNMPIELYLKTIQMVCTYARMLFERIGCVLLTLFLCSYECFQTLIKYSVPVLEPWLNGVPVFPNAFFNRKKHIFWQSINCLQLNAPMHLFSLLKSRSTLPTIIPFRNDVFRYCFSGKGEKSNERGTVLLQKSDFQTCNFPSNWDRVIDAIEDGLARDIPGTLRSFLL